MSLKVFRQLALDFPGLERLLKASAGLLRGTLAHESGF